MAKKKSTNVSRGREVSTLYKPSLAMLPLVPLHTIKKDIFNDRRKFNPTRSVARVASTVAEASQIVHRSTRRRDVWSVGFRNPPQVSICKRRNARRSVLHALGIAGRRGIGKGKSRHTNFWSNVKC